MVSIQLYSFRPKGKTSQWDANGMSAKIYVPFHALIVSITKSSIVIGSLRACLSLNWRAITWVSNYTCNWMPVIDTHVVRRTIARVLMASFSTLVISNCLAHRSGSILELLARLPLELYSTRSNYYH